MALKVPKTYRFTSETLEKLDDLLFHYKLEKHLPLNQTTLLEYLVSKAHSELIEGLDSKQN